MRKMLEIRERDGMNKIDKLLRILSTPDWVTPLNTLIEDASNGPSKHFYVNAYAGLSVNDVKRMLKKAGIHAWGVKFLDDMIVCTTLVDDEEAVRKVLRVYLL